MTLKSTINGFSIIGAPHYDGGKIVSALLSERETLTTEIYTGQRWEALPLTSDTLAVLPSKQVAHLLDIPPTKHRILIKDNLNGTPNKPNIALSLTASLLKQSASHLEDGQTLARISTAIGPRSCV